MIYIDVCVVWCMIRIYYVLCHSLYLSDNNSNKNKFKAVPGKTLRKAENTPKRVRDPVNRVQWWCAKCQNVQPREPQRARSTGLWAQPVDQSIPQTRQWAVSKLSEVWGQTEVREVLGCRMCRFVQWAVCSVFTLTTLTADCWGRKAEYFGILPHLAPSKRNDAEI